MKITLKFIRSPQAMTQQRHEEPLTRQQRIKRELRQNIINTLVSTQELPPEQCLRQMRQRFATIQRFCEIAGKPFVVVETEIRCDQYGLGGHSEHRATLFRGADQNALVAICVTHQGSLLHRNYSSWKLCRNAGDVNPE